MCCQGDISVNMCSDAHLRLNNYVSQAAFIAGLLWYSLLQGSLYLPQSFLSLLPPPFLLLQHGKRWFICKLQEQRGSFLLPLKIQPRLTLSSGCTLQGLSLCYLWISVIVVTYSPWLCHRLFTSMHSSMDYMYVLEKDVLCWRYIVSDFILTAILNLVWTKTIINHC